MENQVSNIFISVFLIIEPYLEPCQTSMMEFLRNLLIALMLLTQKRSTEDVW